MHDSEKVAMWIDRLVACIGCVWHVGFARPCVVYAEKAHGDGRNDEKTPTNKRFGSHRVSARPEGMTIWTTVKSRTRGRATGRGS